MGVAGAHSFIKNQKVKFQQYAGIREFATSLQQDTVYVDFFGCFFYKIKKMLYGSLKEKLLGFFISLFRDIPNLVIVYDGARSQEWLETSINRLKKQEMGLIKLEKMLDKCFSLSRIRKRQYQAVENLQLQTFNVKAEDIIYLKAGMINAGINIVEAAFEADVFIASKKNSIVISADGDFYFHKNVKTFGKFSRSGVIAFEKDHILKSLKVSSEQLLVLGVVSGNDYSPNIAGFGIRKNYGLIKKYSSISDNFETCLEKYLKLFKWIPPIE